MSSDKKILEEFLKSELESSIGKLRAYFMLVRYEGYDFETFANEMASTLEYVWYFCLQHDHKNTLDSKALKQIELMDLNKEEENDEK